MKDANNQNRRALYERRIAGELIPQAAELAPPTLTSRQETRILNKVLQGVDIATEKCKGEKEQQENLSLRLGGEFLNIPSVKIRWDKTKTNQMKKLWVCLRDACSRQACIRSQYAPLTTFLHLQYDKTSLDLATFHQGGKMGVKNVDGGVVESVRAWSKERGKGILSAVTGTIQGI